MHREQSFSQSTQSKICVNLRKKKGTQIKLILADYFF